MIGGGRHRKMSLGLPQRFNHNGQQKLSWQRFQEKESTGWQSWLRREGGEHSKPENSGFKQRKGGTEESMRRATLFEDFSCQCQYFKGDTDVNNGYGCLHPKNEKEYGENIAGCYCFKCPLGIEAEQEDADSPDIDWDGLCDDGEVYDSEYLLVDIGESQTEDEKLALYKYDRYMHRYDKQWLDAHGIKNSFTSS